MPLSRLLVRAFCLAAALAATLFWPDESLAQRTSVARKASALRRFYAFVAKRLKLRADNPAARVSTPKRGRTLPRVIKRKEIDALLALPPLFFHFVRYFYF